MLPTHGGKVCSTSTRRHGCIGLRVQDSWLAKPLVIATGSIWTQQFHGARTKSLKYRAHADNLRSGWLSCSGAHRRLHRQAIVCTAIAGGATCWRSTDDHVPDRTLDSGSLSGDRARRHSEVAALAQPLCAGLGAEVLQLAGPLRKQLSAGVHEWGIVAKGLLVVFNKSLLWGFQNTVCEVGKRASSVLQLQDFSQLSSKLRPNVEYMFKTCGWRTLCLHWHQACNHHFCQ